eukprot:2029957-Pyramimonas_sp.AAC.2
MATMPVRKSTIIRELMMENQWIWSSVIRRYVSQREAHLISDACPHRHYDWLVYADTSLTAWHAERQLQSLDRLHAWVLGAPLSTPGGLNLKTDNTGEISLYVLVVKDSETKVVVNEVLGATLLGKQQPGQPESSSVNTHESQY